MKKTLMVLVTTLAIATGHAARPARAEIVAETVATSTRS